MLLLLFAVAPFVNEPLPEGAIARLGSMDRPLRSSTYALAYSPGGKWLAWAGDAYSGRGLLLVDARTGVRHPAWRGTYPFTQSVCFSPSGRYLFGLSAGGVMYEVATGKEVRQFPEGRYGPIAATEEWVAVRAGGWIAVIEIATGRKKREMSINASGLALAAHPDARRKELASLDASGDLVVWDVATGEPKWRAAAHSDLRRGSVALAYDPRGRHLATGGADTLLRLWSPDGKPGRVLSRGDGRPTSLSFGPRGLLAVGFADATARLYDADAGKELRRWAVPGEAVRAIAFAPDGSEVAAGSWVTAVTRWDPRTGKPLGRPPGHVGPVTNLSFRADGHLISVGKDQTVIDWDVLRRTGRAAVVQTGEEFNPTRVLSPDGRRVVVLPGTESSCVVFDTASGKEGCRLRLPPASEHNIVYAAAFSPDGARVAGHAYQGRVHVWDASTGVRQFSSGQVGRPSDREFMGELNLLRYSPDGHRILVRGYERTDGRDLTLLDASNGNSTLSLTGGRSGAWFRPTGRALHLMDPDPREAITRLRIWDGEEFRPLWDNALLRWWNLTVSPDGRLLATSAPEYRGPITIDIREAATGGLVRQRKGQQSMVTALAFSRDGRTLASGSYDGAILLWDVIGKLPPGTPEDDWWRLADQDAGRAFDAACRLSRPEGVALLARKLRPVLPIEPARWSSLLDRLDSDDFAIRERASKELPTLGLGALALARRSLATEKRREVVRRLQAAIRSWPASPERLRETRALMALEHAGAVGLLKRLAAGADGAELTEEARAALNRLAAR